MVTSKLFRILFAILCVFCILALLLSMPKSELVAMGLVEAIFFYSFVVGTPAVGLALLFFTKSAAEVNAEEELKRRKFYWVRENSELSYSNMMEKVAKFYI